VIGAGSVVTRDVPEGVLAAGNPCRVIREIDPATGRPAVQSARSARDRSVARSPWRSATS
jgi:serine acetyltransferase